MSATSTTADAGPEVLDSPGCYRTLIHPLDLVVLYADSLCATYRVLDWLIVPEEPDEQVRQDYAAAKRVLSGILSRIHYQSSTCIDPRPPTDGAVE